MTTETTSSLNAADIGLRCHDVHHGLTNVDPRSGHVAKLKTTRIVGMAANLAVNLRGMDVVEDGEALEQIAAEELGVDSLAFDEVLRLLGDADMVTVRRTGTSSYKIEERVPFHQNLYETLGLIWEDRHPPDIERETVALTEALAEAPRELDHVKSEIPETDLKTILAVGKATQLMKELALSDGTVLLYSPFFIFENPDVLRGIFEAHPNENVQAVMRALRGEQGMLVDYDNPVLKDMVARGLLLTPTISGRGGDASFAFLPYAVSPEYLGVKKAVLEKAVQILACVRYGEHRAVATRIQNPGAVLRRLADPSHKFTIAAHSEHRRQYQTLFRLQIVDFIPSGSWVKVRLIDTPDNRQAVKLALELLEYGEQVSDRGLNDAARQYLTAGERYGNPLKTIRDRRDGANLDPGTWAEVAKTMRGGTIL
jgi:hypothetical protein